jgi:hypothetical protein
MSIDIALPRQFAHRAKRDMLDEHVDARRVTLNALHRWSNHLMQEEGEVELRRQINFANSYTRLGSVMALAAAPDFLSLLVEHWSSCDNIAEWAPALRVKLRDAKRSGLFPLPPAEDDESAGGVLDSLSDVVTVYRGAYTTNGKGLSWSVDRGVAAKFPFLNRYRRPNAERTALLFEATVPKAAIAFVNNTRHEREVVALPEDLTLVSWALAGEVVEEFDPLFLANSRVAA